MELLKILLNIKNFIEIAVIIVEHPGDGPAKKERAIKIVKELMKINDIRLPVPDQILEVILGFAIDDFVGWANEKLWRSQNG